MSTPEERKEEMEGIQVRADALRKLGFPDDVVEKEWRLYVAKRMVGILRDDQSALGTLASEEELDILTLGAGLLAGFATRLASEAEKKAETVAKPRQVKPTGEWLEYTGTLDHIVAKAILVAVGQIGKEHQKVWLPKSKIQWPVDAKVGERITIRVPTWLAEKREMKGAEAAGSV